MEKVLGKINITIMLIGIMLFCGACGSAEEELSREGTKMENVESVTLPEAGWFTVL